MNVATFGKRGLVEKAPEWQRPVAMPSAHAAAHGERADPVPSEAELERVLYWKRTVRRLGWGYLGLAGLIGVVLTLFPFMMLGSWFLFPVLQYVGVAAVIVYALVVVAITLVSLYGQAVIKLHEGRYPTGYKAYMYKHPSVYAVGTVLAVVWYGFFSGNSLQDLTTDFSFKKMFLFEVYQADETSPWAPFWGYLAKAWIGVAILFYGLDKYLGDGARAP